MGETGLAAATSPLMRELASCQTCGNVWRWSLERDRCPVCCPQKGPEGPKTCTSCGHSAPHDRENRDEFGPTGPLTLGCRICPCPLGVFPGVESVDQKEPLQEDRS